MNELFLEEKHENRFFQLAQESGQENLSNLQDFKDPYWRSLFYIISGNERLFSNRHSLINYKENEINSEVWFTGSFSGGEQRLLQLAFNLFTNLPYYLTEGDQKEYISPLEIFSGIDAYNYQLAKNALDVRLMK